MSDANRKFRRRLDAAMNIDDPQQRMSAFLQLQNRFPVWMKETGILGPGGLASQMGSGGGSVTRLAPAPTTTPTGNREFDMGGDMAQAPPTPTGTGPNVATNAPGGNTVQDFMRIMMAARPEIMEQQRQLLGNLGPGMRQAMMTASPELASSAEFYQSRVDQPIPESMARDYQDRLRQAQAARGFTGGGSGPAEQEAARLTGLAEQRRFQAAGAQQQLGMQMLGMGGFGQIPGADLSTIGSIGLGAGGLGLEQRRLAEQVLAGQQQSAAAQSMWSQLMSAITPNPGGGIAGWQGSGGLPGVGTAGPLLPGVTFGAGGTNFPSLI
jgi:hypothetical protein